VRSIGFSTGALAFGSFRDGLAMATSSGHSAVELSALREQELVPLIDALGELDLSGFSYVSIHAPSSVGPGSERATVDSLLRAAHHGWPMIVHPDVITDPDVWRRLGSLLCIENMDNRKPIGRTAEDMAALFDRFPEAGFCCDLGHARQVDPTMTEAFLMLRRFGPRLRQLHVSEVNYRSKHDPLSFASITAFQQVAHRIPGDTPVILESVIPSDRISDEIEKARIALTPVRASISAA
jgi:hypothetical protein